MRDSTKNSIFKSFSNILQAALAVVVLPTISTIGIFAAGT